MKNLTTILLAILFCSNSFVQAQGLEEIIVEKYYLSDENDTSVNDDGGVLPVGSVTYRVYVDLQPGYIFQAAYGEGTHELLIQTDTKFFNNEDRGEKFSNGIGQNRLDDNTVMLDTWLSVGAACEDCIGLLKDEDDGVNTIENGDGVLQNADPLAGIPLTEQDGHIEGMVESVTEVGLSDMLDLFDNTNDIPAPHIFTTTNGAWSSLNGSMGADSLDNKVLIGQFTTDGIFSFELNIQIRNETTLEVENYVAQNPIDNELTDPTLSYSSNDVLDNVVEFKDKVNYLNVFPSPASHQISLELNSEITGTGFYEIFSTSGVQLSAGDFDTNGIKNINVQDLTEGIYLVKVMMNGKSFTSKFIKAAQ